MKVGLLLDSWRGRAGAPSGPLRMARCRTTGPRSHVDAGGPVDLDCAVETAPPAGPHLIMATRWRASFVASCRLSTPQQPLSVDFVAGTERSLHDALCLASGRLNATRYSSP